MHIDERETHISRMALIELNCSETFRQKKRRIKSRGGNIYWELLQPPLWQDNWYQCRNIAQKGWTEADENNPRTRIYHMLIIIFLKTVSLTSKRKKLNNFSNICPMFLILQNTQIMRNSIYLWLKKNPRKRFSN